MSTNVSRRTLLSAAVATTVLPGCLEGIGATEDGPTTVNVECADVDASAYLPGVERGGKGVVAVLLDEDERRPGGPDPDEVIASDHGCFADRPVFETLFERVDDPDHRLPSWDRSGGESHKFLSVEVTDDDVTDEELAEGIAVVRHLHERRDERGDDLWAVDHDGEPLMLGAGGAQ